MIFNNICRVAKRELVQISKKPIYIISTIVALLFCYLFFFTLMSEGLPERLPIGVADLDNSVISARLCREINSTQATEIVIKESSFTALREEMQRGKIYGIMVIPHNFYSDLLSGKNPTLSFYINNSYLIAGTLAYRDLLSMSVLSNAAYHREVLKAKGYNERDAMGIIQPIIIDNHQIGNSWSNYGIYLLNVLLPGVLQLLVLMSTVYSVGMELKFRSANEWLKCSGGSIVKAVTGKLLPYSILYIIAGLAGNVFMYKVMGYPMNGSFTVIAISTVIFVLAHQAIGVFMVGLFPVLRLATSFAALYGILSFTYAGFTFPIEAMPPLAQGASYLFPLRYYFLVYTREALFASDFAMLVLPLTAMASFIALPLVVIKRLKKAILNGNYSIK